MKCDELQPLQGAYLDSELDARTSVEIEQHLKACPNCARLFAEEEKLAARLKAGLNQGPRTAALWDEIERSVAAAAPPAARPQPAVQLAPLGGWRARFLALSGQLKAGWGRSRWAWSGLAAAWVGILALNFAAREPASPLVAQAKVPLRSEMRLAWMQQQLLMAELAGPSEPTPADKARTGPPSPHSERRTETLNT